MATPRLTLIALICVLLISQTRINGEEVELKVKPGENITLYCDRSFTTGSLIVWIRNCSHENQPSLEIGYGINTFGLNWKLYERFIFIQNSSSNSTHLHIPNISASDLGLYYCAEVEKKVNKDKNGIISGSTVYKYGNRITRLSLEETPCSGLLNITSSLPPESDCVFCWTLLFSVCPVCVLLSSLLSSICVYCFCQPRTTGLEWSSEILTGDDIKRDRTEKHQCEMCKIGQICIHTEVSYRLMTSERSYAKI